MGTDIHLEVEIKKNGVWERFPHPPQPCTSCADYDIETDTYGEPRGFHYPWVEAHEVPLLEAQGYNRIGDEERNGRVQMSKQKPCYRCKGEKVVWDQMGSDRNYDVFGMLADVRNGSGFAGIDTGDGFVPIDEPRGLPEDMSSELIERLRRVGQGLDGEYLEAQDNDDVYDEFEKTQEGYWSLGEHSFSYVTLREVLEYDYNRTTKRRGWVDPWNYELWRRTGAPNSWSGGISGGSVEHVTHQAMGRMIDSNDIKFEGSDEDWSEGRNRWQSRPYTTGLQRAMGGWDLQEGTVGAAIRDKQSYYCLIEWEVPYLDSLSHFKEEMEQLAQYAPDGDLDRVRLVFGFDS